MKTYKIEYFSGDSSKPLYLIQISKSGKKDGVRVWFFINNDIRYYQGKYKSNLLNGIDKLWRSNSKNSNFRNWKKNKTQGIQIIFK